ncbi:MAG: DNA mismatch repair endonuclease MutL [Fidelibacterota bacterium]
MIAPLSTELRNKISAGEVVERPASAVKELVENSLDAGARSIRVVLEQGGNRLIQVTDDGSGIVPEELSLAFQRYTTSKISAFDDLYAIRTMGFRGEALASIASVSRVEVLSSTDGNQGARLTIEDGNTIGPESAPAIQGTSIAVRDLFFNTPARKKFLKSPRTEFRKVVEALKRLALAHPEVSLTLIHDEKTILDIPPHDLRSRIDALFDPTYSRSLLDVDIEKGDYRITGFVGNLNLVRSRPGEQFLFLNRRFIKDRLLNSAVYSAYQSLVKRGEFPFFALNLRIPSDQIDVNVHPMKIEVRFRDEWRIYHVLKNGLMERLSEILETAPDFQPQSFHSVPETRSFDFGGHAARPAAMPPATASAGAHGDFSPTSQGLESTVVKRAVDYASHLAGRKGPQPEIATDSIWQVHNKYILSQINSGLVIIDQHVAHERILYEEALAAMETRPMTSQTLLFPEHLQFSPDELSRLLEILPRLEKLGFKLVSEPDQSIRVEAVPAVLGWGNEKQVIRNILDATLTDGNSYGSELENFAASFACHAAIKAGDPLTQDEMQELVNRLFGTKHPYYCPHGRPIIVQLTLDELDRRFERPVKR